MDVDREDSVREGVARVLAAEGRIDVLVNNAGFGLAGAVEDTSIEEARSLIETNLLGPLRLCRAVLPAMRDQGCGLIVNVSSLAGRAAVPFQGIYSATKFALEGLTEALRMEARPFGVAVVLLEPGDLRTGFTASRRVVAAARVNPAYRERFARALAAMEKDERHGAGPGAAAAALVRIVGARSPRLRYAVGPLTERSAVWLRRFAPPALFERLVAAHYEGTRNRSPRP